MFDTMTMTKAVAGVCGALLVFLLGNCGHLALCDGRQPWRHGRG